MISISELSDIRQAIIEIIRDCEIDNEWFERHMKVKSDDATKTITITIDNMNEQDYNYIKEEI